MPGRPLSLDVTRRLKAVNSGESPEPPALRRGRAGAKAIGPRRASSRSCVGARGARAVSGTVSACNQALQATQSRRVQSVPFSSVTHCFARGCHWASGRLSFDRYTAPAGRELRAAVLGGVLLRLGRAGSKAPGPRRASSNSGLGARGQGRFLARFARVTRRCR